MLADDVISAWRLFRIHKLRTGLAVLGIAISVASIVVLVSIAHAKARDTAAYFNEAGARIAQIAVLDQRGLELIDDSASDFRERYNYGAYERLTYRPIKDWRDADYLKAACPNTVAHITAFAKAANAPPNLVCGPFTDDQRIYGVTDEFFECIGPKVMPPGRAFTREDIEERHRVAVISWEILHEYLGEVFEGKDKLEEAYGEGYGPDDLPLTLMDDENVVRINGIRYDIVGILPPVCPVLEAFFRYNYGCFVPFDRERELNGEGATNRFLFYPKGTAEEAFAELKPLIEKMYPGSTATLQSAEMWAQQERSELGAATTGFVLIGLGTLFVSAMAVMNTMLVSVRERRPEIGIRKALGASQKDIRRQFIHETMAISAMGILAGILLAFVVAFLVEALQNAYIMPILRKWAKETQFGSGGWRMEPRGWDIHFGVVALAAGISALVALGISLLASLLPAREAAAMDPVACLANRSTPRGGRVRRWALLRSAWFRPFFEDPERTWLAISSLSVGVAVVIVLTGVGEYNRLRAADWYDRLGPDSVYFDLSLVVPNWEEDLPGMGQSFLKRLEKECPHVENVWTECWMSRELQSSGAADLRSAALTVNKENRTKYRLWGADAVPAGRADFFPHRPLLAGREITQEDIDTKAPVCIVDEHAAKTLFPDGDALGGWVEFGGVTFTVQGIISNQDPYDDRPWGGLRIPISWGRDVIGTDESFWLLAHTSDPRAACREIADLYQDTFKLALQEPLRHFKMVGEEQARARREAWLNAFLTMSIGLGTLLVGGVGMMNTMLISTTARTREVGVLRALGASRAAIIRQFLFESIVLSLGGGIVGVVVGLGFTWFGLPVLYLAWDRSDILWHTVLSLHWPVIALFFAVFVGLISALGPAIKASVIRPAEALRYE